MDYLSWHAWFVRTWGPYVRISVGCAEVGWKIISRPAYDAPADVYWYLVGLSMHVATSLLPHFIFVRSCSQLTKATLAISSTLACLEWCDPTHAAWGSGFCTVLQSWEANLHKTLRRGNHVKSGELNVVFTCGIRSQTWWVTSVDVPRFLPITGDKICRFCSIYQWASEAQVNLFFSYYF